MQTTNRVVIAGGSGFLGLNLAEYLTGFGYDVVVLSRQQPERQGAWRFVRWDARGVGEWCRELEGAAAVVNLAGRIECPCQWGAGLRHIVTGTA